MAIERRAPVEPCGELAERIERNVERMATMIDEIVHASRDRERR
jgi:hypothetical protein